MGTPERLFTNGRYAFGTYSEPIARPNVLDRWGGLARRAHGVRVKEWQAYQLADDDTYVLGAIYDAKTLGLLQVVVVTKATGAAARFEYRLPSPALSIAQGLHGTRSAGRWRSMSMSVANDLANGIVRVSARHARGGLRLDVTGRCGPEHAGHLVISHPFPNGHVLYSHKSAMPAEGVLVTPVKEVTFHPSRSILTFDDHKGHYPLPMVYDWVSGSRIDADGRRVALNLTHNQVRDPERFNENAVFLDERVFRLPAVSVARPTGVHGPWRVTDRDGAVDVTFHPEVRNEQHVGPRSSLVDYVGPFGWFSGSIDLGSGEQMSVDGCYGMGERKRIRM